MHYDTYHEKASALAKQIRELRGQIIDEKRDHKDKAKSKGIINRLLVHMNKKRS